LESKGVPPKKVFVISYSEKRETKFDLKKMKALYKSSGFEFPQIIFWNVNDIHYVCKDVDKLVINGFSSVILNSIMNIEDLSCVSIMNNIMKSDRYKKLTGDQYFVEDCGDIEILNVPVGEEMSTENKSYCSVM
jgi:hypothetical protein